MSIPLPKKIYPPLAPKASTKEPAFDPYKAPPLPVMLSKRSPTAKNVDRDETLDILDDELWPRHRSDPKVIGFIQEYLQCRNVKQAAASVGLTVRDGNCLRRSKDIHAALTRITDAAVFKHGFDAAELIERVKEVADADLIEFENADGSYKESLQDIPPETRRAIKSLVLKNTYGTDPNGMQVITGKIIKIEMWDKMKGIELLGRERNLFKESKVVEHDIGRNMSATLLESRDRAEKRLQTMKDVTDITDVEEDDE